MIRHLEGVMVSSQNSTKLGEYYKNVVGLSLSEMYEGKEGNMYAFNDVGLFINPHSEVKGKNTMPGRHILNFQVDDIEKEVKRLKKNGAKQTQEVYEVEGYGLISTFEDPDGNLYQLVELGSRVN